MVLTGTYGAGLRLAIAVVGLCGAAILVLTLGGAEPWLFKDNPQLDRWIALMVGAICLLSALFLLIAMLSGHPRLEIAPGRVALHRFPGVVTRLDLSRFGPAFGGRRSVSGKSVPMLFFYSVEREQALRQAGVFEPPDAHSAEAALDVLLLVGEDQDKHKQLCEAVNRARRPGPAPRLGTAETAAQLQAHKRVVGRRQVLSGFGMFGLAALQLIADMQSSAPFVVGAGLLVGAAAALVFWSENAIDPRAALVAGFSRPIRIGAFGAGIGLLLMGLVASFAA